MFGNANGEDSATPASLTDRPPGVATSAVTGDGLDCLIDEMLHRLIPVAPGLGDGVPFTESQAHLIGTVLEFLENDQVEQAMQRLQQFLEENGATTVVPQD